VFLMRARLASNPYPKAFFVSTSVYFTLMMMRELLFAPTFILAINNPSEVFAQAQAKFFQRRDLPLRVFASVTFHIYYTTRLCFKREGAVCNLNSQRLTVRSLFVRLHLRSVNPYRKVAREHCPENPLFQSSRTSEKLTTM